MSLKSNALHIILAKYPQFKILLIHPIISLLYLKLISFHLKSPISKIKCFNNSWKWKRNSFRKKDHLTLEKLFKVEYKRLSKDNIISRIICFLVIQFFAKPSLCSKLFPTWCNRKVKIITALSDMQIFFKLLAIISIIFMKTYVGLRLVSLLKFYSNKTIHITYYCEELQYKDRLGFYIDCLEHSHRVTDIYYWK